MKKQKKFFWTLPVIAIFLFSYVFVFTTGKIIINASVGKVPDKESNISMSNSENKEISKDNKTQNSFASMVQVSKEISNTANSGEKQQNPNESSLMEENPESISASIADVSETTETDISTVSDVSQQSNELVESIAEISNDSSIHAEKLISSLTSAGYSVNDLDSSCKQLITVNSSGSYAQISFFELNADGVWEELNDLMTDGYVGENGVSKDSKEGSKMTPFGLYEVGQAFYIDTVPQTSLDMFQITNDTYWVDDPDSAFYNQHMEGLENMDWNSAEHMIDFYNSYRFGFVIEFNTKNTIKGKGSAIFFHISSQSTAGCVGVPEGMMIKYLAELDKNCNPYILIQ